MASRHRPPKSVAKAKPAAKHAMAANIATMMGWRGISCQLQIHPLNVGHRPIEADVHINYRPIRPRGTTV
jgi:hypothetical protein